jgi:hypothetical protein
MRTACWCDARVHFWRNIHAEGTGASVQTKFLAAFENLLKLWVSKPDIDIAQQMIGRTVIH